MWDTRDSRWASKAIATKPKKTQMLDSKMLIIYPYTFLSHLNWIQPIWDIKKAKKWNQDELNQQRFSLYNAK